MHCGYKFFLSSKLRQTASIQQTAKPSNCIDSQNRQKITIITSNQSLFIYLHMRYRNSPNAVITRRFILFSCAITRLANILRLRQMLWWIMAHINRNVYTQMHYHYCAHGFQAGHNSKQATKKGRKKSKQIFPYLLSIISSRVVAVYIWHREQHPHATTRELHIENSERVYNAQVSAC